MVDITPSRDVIYIALHSNEQVLPAPQIKKQHSSRQKYKQELKMSLVEDLNAAPTP